MIENCVWFSRLIRKVAVAVVAVAVVVAVVATVAVAAPAIEFTFEKVKKLFVAKQNL